MVPPPDSPVPPDAVPPGAGADMTETLLARTQALVDIPSVSGDEGPLVQHLQDDLSAVTGLELTRVGDNLVARTHLGRPSRVILAGHTDTVPPSGGQGSRREGDDLVGLGAADMKGGLAVMVELAHRIGEQPARLRSDVTWIFYAREEVAASDSGLLELIQHRPDLLTGDVAVLGEPTGGVIEAGCQGTLRVRMTLSGARAHTARPWMGRNALHRLAAVVVEVAGMAERRPVLSGCEFREATQAVSAQAGVAPNVVPDQAQVVINHRFAPDRDAEAALAHLRETLGPLLESGDEVVVEDSAPAAPPGIDHPLLAELVGLSGGGVRAKLGWTDVARFAELGIPAVNLGPGEPALAHTPGERVSAQALAGVYLCLERWLAE